MRKVLYAISMAAMALVASGCEAINEELPTYEETSIVESQDKAPDFTTTLLSGESITLSQLQGQIVLLIFFSHTCPDCKALLDDIKRAESEMSEIRIIAIAREGTRDEIEEYIAANEYSFDIAIDNNREIYNQYATMYVPRCYLIDKEGIVVTTTVEYSADHVATLLSQIEALR